MKNGGFLKRTVRAVPLRGKTVLLRADLNVPLTEKGEIADDFRVIASLPTLRYLIEQRCRVVICSHLGRPQDASDNRFSLELVAERLAVLLKQPVDFVPDCVGDRVMQSVKRLRAGDVLLLENLRFHSGEETNDPGFAAQLAHDTLAEYFVQDGFGVVHRAHASTQAITHRLPSVAGLLVEKEYTAIRTALDQPKKPLVAILGGAKVSDKIAVIEKFVAIADSILIGGAMANTFLSAKDLPVGKSLREKGLEGVVEKIYAAARKKVGADRVDDFIVLPQDVVVATSRHENVRRMSVSVEDVNDDEMILDIGPESIARAAAIVAQAGTVVWNGTMGYAELPQFSHGSARMALAMVSNANVMSVIGGGDTVDFVRAWDVEHGGSFTHVSTGGGASLDLMAGLPMPGIDALLDA